ncbi:MAG: 50S ribosome-binding GTPase [Actinomycetaceae bacterium]|nr:50S ribosome-binding GTPase [Arcanobacterium sp.]MDD7687554.1 50S ribosome-binding GTPase [Actinomycetaceae bacterium]MDY5273028.1 GTPase [Arcanobacterium sp.]
MVDAQLRLTQLQQAVAAGGEFFTSGVTARAQEDLRLAYERMSVGDGFVVVALVGGTGSGKSSLFNRLTGLDFAAVGEMRPTTQEVMACTWGGDSSRLLSILDVAPHAQFHFESILTAGTDDHEAVILLDTPDYDSVQLDHSGQVARIIPLVDVLIWVLDPQKYADANIYHNLVTLGNKRAPEKLDDEAAAPMVVVLNKIDTVPKAERSGIVADLRDKLDALGFAHVPLYVTSALTGEGIHQLDRALSRASEDHSVWHRTAVAQLDSVARILQTQVGSEEADLEGAFLDELIDTVAEASGLGAAAEAIRAAAVTGGSHQSAVSPQAPAPTIAVAVRDMWITHAITGLPQQWQAGVERSVPSAERLRKHIAKALGSVPLPTIVKKRPWGWITGGILVAALGLVCAVFGIPSPDSWLRAVCATVGVVVGIAAVIGGFWWERRRAQRKASSLAQAYVEAVRAALAQELHRDLAEKPEAIIKRHRAARTLLGA